VKSSELEQLRSKIDDIDRDVTRLLNDRVHASAEIGRIKNQQGLDPYDPAREEEVFRKLEKLNEGGLLEAETLRTIYREVISASIALQKDLQIGYLGPEATFTHQAAIKNFGSALSYKPLSDIPDVFREVERSECDYGVVPVENSTEGAVNRSLDLLVDTELTIIAQVYLKIEHCLLSTSPLDEIEKVSSKDQALAQCGEWLRRNLPTARLENATSTAEAVRTAKGASGTAAIAGALAGRLYDVPCIAEGIQDHKDNLTRFLVVGRKSLAHREDVEYKTSLVLSLTDKVSALQEGLRPFGDRGINLCKIESRPSRLKPWDYYFFVDFLGHRDDETASEVISELENVCPFVKCLGSYPNTSS
jgi:chorismate mutase / prephenate dehydratase